MSNCQLDHLGPIVSAMTQHIPHGGDRPDGVSDDLPGDDHGSGGHGADD
jgi:hypothetical protein